MKRAALLSLLLLAACEDDGPRTDGTAGPSPAATLPTEDGGGGQGLGACKGAAGRFHEQSFEHEGEARIYELFVPSTFTCERTWPLLVELHGAYGGAQPEEAYINDELLAVAERRGVVVARLRARPSEVRGQTWYYWDNPATDLQKNQRAMIALVDHLSSAHNVDPKRVWASGYSSGGNLALSLLSLPKTPFKAIGAIASGLWSKVALPSRFEADAPRVYAAAGYRDLHHGYWRATVAKLRAGGYGEATLFERETDDGHSFLAWHVDEMLGWFEDGKVPAPTKAATWTKLPGPGTASLLEVARTKDGALVVGDAAGAVHLAEGGSWRSVWNAASEPVVALSAHASGGVAAATQSKVVLSADGGRTFHPTPALPKDPAIGIAYVNGIAVTGTDVVAAGSSIFAGGNGLMTWDAKSLQGVDVQAIELLSNGDAIAVGRFSIIARAGAGGVTAVTPPAALGDRFLHAVRAAGDQVLVVGEHGTILRSVDGGGSFALPPTPTVHDLYAVAFEGQRAIAAGAHGSVLLSTDGGATWTDASVGEDIMLAGAAFDGDGAAIVVGERGAMYRLPPK